jgi:hypothetical protein
LIRDASGEEHFAQVKIPDTIPQLVALKSAEGEVEDDSALSDIPLSGWTR